MTLTLDKPSFAPRPKRWTKREYTGLTAHGAFQGQHVYLFRGELIEVAPMGSPHLIAVNRLNMWACRTFCPPYMVICQSPFETPGQSIPEPDVAVVTEDQFLRRPQPARALLVVEVSDSSLDIDQKKAFEYAAAGVPEYWIVDVTNRQLLVHREVVANASTVLGFRYSSIQTLANDGAISPLAKPSISVSVAEFLQGI